MSRLGLGRTRKQGDQWWAGPTVWVQNDGDPYIGCMCVYVFIYTHVYIYADVYVCAYICIHVHVCVFGCLCIL